MVNMVNIMFYQCFLYHPQRQPHRNQCVFQPSFSQKFTLISSSLCKVTLLSQYQEDFSSYTLKQFMDDYTKAATVHGIFMFVLEKKMTLEVEERNYMNGISAYRILQMLQEMHVIPRVIIHHITYYDIIII